MRRSDLALDGLLAAARYHHEAQPVGQRMLQTPSLLVETPSLLVGNRTCDEVGKGCVANPGLGWGHLHHFKCTISRF